MTQNIEQAIADAVDLVNHHSGQTCVWLRFADDPGREIDLIASSARFSDGHFEFQAGYETLAGSVAELANIRAQLIPH